MKKKSGLIVTVGTILILFVLGLADMGQGNRMAAQSTGIKNFAECAKVYPVMESKPRQCQTPDGKRFVEGGQTPDESGQKAFFEQPILDGIAGNFHVPTAEHKYPSEQPFNLLLWQPNPNRPDGELVPTDWKAGDRTGFYPDGPLREHQAGFRDAPGTSTLQIEGGTVGVYLNSHDLPNGSGGNKMMITPAFKPPAEQSTYPFANPGVKIVTSLELQVPVAQDVNRPGNFTYVVADLQFEDRQTHTQISYGIVLFHHAKAPGPPNTPEWLKKTEVGVFDEPSHSFQVGNPVAPGSRVVTMLPGSTLWQQQPWKGWRSFQFAITSDNFKTALQALKERAPAFKGSQNPADYALVQWHLNAELTFGTGPAELGWSMRRARVTFVSDDQPLSNETDVPDDQGGSAAEGKDPSKGVNETIPTAATGKPEDMQMHDVPWPTVGEVARRFVAEESPASVWPFQREDLHAMATSPRKVFIHYFTPLPISLDNKPIEADYWATQYLQRSGEGNKYANVGGYVRQRPLPGGPWDSPYWKEIDAAVDVLRARQMGADGFGVDILQFGPGRYWDQTRMICAAAAALAPDFHFVIEIDGAAAANGKTSVDDIVKASAELATCPAIYRLPDGRIPYVPFAPDSQSPQFWRQVKDQLAARKIPIAFVPDLLDPGRSADSFAPISSGLSFWGARDPQTINSVPFKNMEHHAMSLAPQYWMQPVAAQDARQKTSLLWEASNSGLLRASWTRAIENHAPLVHMLTWNDYGEATEFAPSSGSQFFFYDLSAYYLQWYKTGKPPRITADAIYYSHRTQIFDPVKPVAAGDRPYRLMGTTPLHNDVEMVAMLTQPAKLQIELAGKHVEVDVPAGLQALRMAASPGRPVFRILRGGKTIVEKVSDWTIERTPKTANADYFGGSSTRPFQAIPAASALATQTK